MDREEKSEYELLVEAVDQGQPRKSSQTVVKVLVEDANDQAPGKNQICTYWIIFKFSFWRIVILELQIIIKLFSYYLLLILMFYTQN